MSELSKAFTQDIRRKPCILARIISSLDADDAELLTRLLDNGGITHSHVARTLTDAGHRIGNVSVRRHVIGACSCE